MDLGSDGAVKRLLAEAAKAAGASLPLAAEARADAEKLAAAQLEFDALVPEYELRKAALDEARAPIEARRAALGASKFKAWQKTAAGKAMAA